MVGKTGFEPATPWSQTKCSTKLSYFPFNQNNYGAEDRNRTGTVVTYRRILSPVRLPVPPPRQEWSGRRDSNPRPPPSQGGVLPLNYFRIIVFYFASQKTLVILLRKTLVRVKGVEPPRLAAP